MTNLIEEVLTDDKLLHIYEVSLKTLNWKRENAAYLDLTPVELESIDYLIEDVSINIATIKDNLNTGVLHVKQSN